MADLSGYIPIYVRSTGDDATGDGSEFNPYLSAQKAFEVAFFLNSAQADNYVLDFGTGSYGGVNLSAATASQWPVNIAVRGVAVIDTSLGGIDGSGAGLNGTGASITIISDNSINLGDVISNAGGSSSIHGGAIELTDIFCENITSNGDGSGYGGNVTLNSVTVNYSVTANGSTGGSVSASGCDIQTITVLSNGLSNGSINLTNTIIDRIIFKDNMSNDLMISDLGGNTFFSGWVSDVAIYYINSRATDLSEFGTGYWNSTGNGGNAYYIGGVITTLDASGNGCWNNTTYTSGVADDLSNYTGWNICDNTYYISASPTTLDSTGSGDWNGYHYTNGNYSNGCIGGHYYTNGILVTFQGTGWDSCSEHYYIDSAETSLDSDGNGCWNNTSYITGNAEYDINTYSGLACSNIYYINGTPTTLDQNGSGYWDNSYYINGENTGSSLDSNGNGCWNGNSYTNGVVASSSYTGYNYCNSIYYISGSSTTLNSNGTGVWNTSYYYNGNLITGWVYNGDMGAGDALYNLNLISSGTYFISGKITTLDSNGSGAWNNPDDSNADDVFYYKAIEIPSTIYIRSTGSDENGMGTIDNPFSTAQKAITVVEITTYGNYTLDFGAGHFNGITLSKDLTTRISIHGAGADVSFLDGINANGADRVIDYGTGTEVTVPTPGFNIEISNDKSIDLGSIYANAGDIDDSGYYWNPNTQDYSHYNSGFTGNTITLTNCIAGTVSSTGGNIYGNNGGTGGTITILNSTIVNIISDGGSGNGLNGGHGGNISVTNSTVTSTITANGSGGDYGGNGGNLTLIDSKSGDITLGAGGGGMGNGSGGSVALEGSTIIPNNITAGSVASTNLKKGRGVNGSNILGLI